MPKIAKSAMGVGKVVASGDKKVERLLEALLLAYINKNGRIDAGVTRDIIGSVNEAAVALGWQDKAIEPVKEVVLSVTAPQEELA